LQGYNVPRSADMMRILHHFQLESDSITTAQKSVVYVVSLFVSHCRLANLGPDRGLQLGVGGEIVIHSYWRRVAKGLTTAGIVIRIPPSILFTNNVPFSHFFPFLQFCTL
jgi:hypothetical protein